MAKIICVVHQADSDTGRIGEGLLARGFDVEICRPCLGDSLPETLNDHAGAVVFGGPMSANDGPRLPYIADEIAWIRQVALPAAKPFLGVCLGAQMLSKALGGQVAPHANGKKEIGYFPVRPAPGAEDWLPDPLWVYHWHQEGFTLPAGTRLLAQGSIFPNQMFQAAPRAIGLQFHPEVTHEIRDKWITSTGNQPEARGGQSRAEQERGAVEHHGRLGDWLDGFLNRWLAG